MSKTAVAWEGDEDSGFREFEEGGLEWGWLGERGGVGWRVRQGDMAGRGFHSPASHLNLSRQETTQCTPRIPQECT